MEDSKSRKYYRTDEFIKTQNIWYKKLADSGFADLEWLDKKSGAGHATPFLRDSLWKYRNIGAFEASQTLEYYNAAQEFSQVFTFPSKLHKFVWSLHAEGLSYRRIADKCRTRAFKHKPSIFWISIHIRKLKQEMFYWLADQDQPEETWEDFIASNTQLPL